MTAKVLSFAQREQRKQAAEASLKSRRSRGTLLGQLAEARKRTRLASMSPDERSAHMRAVRARSRANLRGRAYLEAIVQLTGLVADFELMDVQRDAAAGLDRWAGCACPPEQDICGAAIAYRDDDGGIRVRCSCASDTPS